MPKVVLPKTEPWQKEVLDYYLENPKDKWVVVKAIRQCGKSILMQILLVAASIREENSVSISVSPVMSQSRKMYQDICSFAEPIIKKANGTLLEIKFVNGSIIKFRSMEQGDSIRGETCKKSGILVVDEAAYQKDEIFYSILVPTTNVFHNDIFIVSTPKFRIGFYYDLYCKGLEENGKIISFDWTKYDTSKFLPKETLEIYRKQLPKTSFASEFLGEWISGDGSVFTDFKRCVGSVKLGKSKELLITIDWACGNGGSSDSTVLTIGQKIDNKIGIKNQIAFNDKKPIDTCNYILDLVKSFVSNGYRNITLIMEKNSIGNVYYAILVELVDEFEQEYNNNVTWKEEIEINLHTFLTTNDSKKRIIERLEILFEQDLIILPDDEELLTELSMFEAKVNQNGTVIYGVQNSSHDDRVLSLCFLVDRLYNELEL